MKSNQVPSNDKTSHVLEPTDSKASSSTDSRMSNHTLEIILGEAWNENEGVYTKLGIKIIQTLGLPTFESGNGVIEDILQTKQIGYWNGLYAIPATFCGVIFSFIVTLIPYQNTVEYPLYWYETPILIPILFVLLALNALLQCYYCFKSSDFISFRCFFQVWIPAAMMSLVLYFMMLIIWTIVWEYNLPLPHTNKIQLLGVFGFIPALGMEIYKRNKNDGDAIRILWFVLHFAYLGPFLDATYLGIEILTDVLPSDIQWFIALVLPGMREIHVLVTHKILLKAKPYSPELTLFCIDMVIHCYHSFWVTLFLVRVTDITVYSILGIEFLLQLYSCYQIIKIGKKIQALDSNNYENEQTELKKALAGLVLGESLEVLVPFSYLIWFLSAYYGPNAFILGNIRNSYWGFREVNDVVAVIIVTLKMFSIDLGIGIITGLILWIICRIDFLQEFCKLVKRYWALIALRIGSILIRVSFIDNLGI